MKEEIYYYQVFVMGGEEPIYLNYAKGMELSAALIGGNPPKFVYIDGNVVSVSSIREVRRVQSLVPSEDYKYQVAEQRELTGAESVAKERLESITRQKKQLKA